MKKQKLKRRTYRPVSKKVKTVKKIVWRILFVLICAAALCVFSVYLGSWLKERAAQIDGILQADTQQSESVSEETLPPPTEAPEEGVPARAAYLDVLGMSGADIEKYIYNLHESYNTVSIDITSEDGKLVYVSPALLEYVKLDPSAVTASPVVGSVKGDDGEYTEYEIDVLSNIKTALDAAKRKDLRVCAVYSTTSAVMQSEAYESAWDIDAVVASELYSLGFDEVMIDGLFSEEHPLDAENVNRAVRYTAELKNRAEGFDIGLVIPEEAVFVPANASIVNMLSEYTDFLCVYVSGEGADAEEAYSVAYEEFHSVKGALSAYNVRAVILNGDGERAAAVATALTDLTSVGVQFTCEVTSPVYSPESADDTDETETEYPADTGYNENANRKDDYTNDTEYKEETAEQDTGAID
ncbi:MAG: hypothetical protein IJO81_04345 [Clostridia bacterium]|nr:hypothetical protein [Clostridia bacterium]